MRDHRPITSAEDFNAVMQLLFQAYSMTEANQTLIQEEIAKQKQAAYEDELTKMATLAGCAKNGIADMYTAQSIQDESGEEAFGIVETYNFELANAIIDAYNNNPTAGRNEFYDALEKWNNTRAEWKSIQISMHNEQEWRAQAQMDFTTYNDLTGWAEVLPKNAAEPVCQDLADRGRMPIVEAQQYMAVWPPHLNCPHYWDVHPGQIADCGDMWLGANSGVYVQQGGR